MKENDGKVSQNRFPQKEYSQGRIGGSSLTCKLRNTCHIFTLIADIENPAFYGFAGVY